jgi:hypothetical protein
MSTPTPARSVLTRRIPSAPPAAPGADTEVMPRADITQVLARADIPHAVDVRPRGRTYGRRAGHTARRRAAVVEAPSLTYRALAVAAVICSAGVVAGLVLAVCRAL